MVILSDGSLTTSKRLYLQDAIKLAFSIDSRSIPNSDLGVILESDMSKSVDRLRFNEICKSIDPSLEVTQVNVVGDRIKVVIDYPYGELEVELDQNR